jgi:hypothetical protein
VTSAFDTLEYHSTYMGINIYKNISPGFRLKWTSGNLAADTLTGLKKLIREFRCVNGGHK